MLLHNPEYFWKVRAPLVISNRVQATGQTSDAEFYERIGRAFAALEKEVTRGAFISSHPAT